MTTDEQSTKDDVLDALLEPLDALAAYWSASDHRVWQSTCGDELTDALVDLRRALRFLPELPSGANDGE